jgi:hypothetical protein
MPRPLWRQQEAEKADKKMGQAKLGFETIKAPQEFTREGVVDAVAKFIATDDQVRYPITTTDLRLTLSC